MSWTITPTISYSEKAQIKHALYGDMCIVLRLACVSDANTGTVTLRTTAASGASTNYPDIMDQIAHSTLYLMEVVPGAGGDAPSAAFDIDIENKRNSHILDTDSNSHTATSFTAGSDTLGLFPPIFEEITIVIGTLGDANTADIYLYFWK